MGGLKMETEGRWISGGPRNGSSLHLSLMVCERLSCGPSALLCAGSHSRLASSRPVFAIFSSPDSEENRGSHLYNQRRPTTFVHASTWVTTGPSINHSLSAV